MALPESFWDDYSDCPVKFEVVALRYVDSTKWWNGLALFKEDKILICMIINNRAAWAGTIDIVTSLHARFRCKWGHKLCDITHHEDPATFIQAHEVGVKAAEGVLGRLIREGDESARLLLGG